MVPQPPSYWFGLVRWVTLHLGCECLWVPVMKPLHIGPKASFRPDSSLRSSLLSRSCRRRHNSPLVPYHSDSLEQWTAQVPVTDPIIHKVTCEKTCLENVWIPKPSSISIRPHHKQQDELEDWEADVSALFEWIGMAGFHSERCASVHLLFQPKRKFNFPVW